MVESWWFQAMAQDGYARHGLHKHHVGCSAQGHGWRGQICQVVWRIMRKIRGWHFFSSGLLFRSLKGNWPLFGETTRGEPATGWSPRFAKRLLRLRPNASSHQALSSLQRTDHVFSANPATVQRVIGKFTSLEFPPRNRRKWRLDLVFSSYHTCIRPLVVTFGVCGDHPKTVDRCNPARVWMVRAPQSMGYLPHQLKCCKFCPSTIAGSNIWNVQFGNTDLGGLLCTQLYSRTDSEKSPQSNVWSRF